MTKWLAYLIAEHVEQVGQLKHVPLFELSHYVELRLPIIWLKLLPEALLTSVGFIQALILPNFCGERNRDKAVQ